MPIGAELTSRLLGAASGAKAALEGEVGIYRHLIADHTELLSLMGAAESASEAAQRAELFAIIRQQLTVHAEAEEKAFYGALASYPETLEYVQINVDEHRALGALLATLQHIGPLSREWEELFGKLKTLLTAHVAREEGELFAASKARITSPEAKALEIRFIDQKRIEALRLDAGEQPQSRYDVPIP